MKFVIMHGAYGSKDGNWFPYLKNQLELLNQEVILEQFPVNDLDEITKLGEKKAKATKQNLDNWLKYFKENIFKKIKNEKNLVVIGHSLAPVFILHLADKFNLKLDSAIFVSPFLELDKNMWQFHLVNQSFFKKDFDFTKLQKLIPSSYTVFGDDDPYVKREQIMDFANKMKSNLVPVKGGKHLNAEFKFFSFPLILELCKTRLDVKEYL